MAFNWSRGPKGPGWLMLFGQFVPSGPPTSGEDTGLWPRLDRDRLDDDQRKKRDAEALAVILLMEQQC